MWEGLKIWRWVGAKNLWQPTPPPYFQSWLLCTCLLIIQKFCQVLENHWLVIQKENLTTHQFLTFLFIINFNIEYILVKFSTMKSTCDKSYFNKTLHFETMVFCYQNCSDILWEKFVLVIEKTFSNFSCMFLNPNNFFQFEFLLF